MDNSKYNTVIYRTQLGVFAIGATIAVSLEASRFLVAHAGMDPHIVPQLARGSGKNLGQAMDYMAIINLAAMQFDYDKRFKKLLGLRKDFSEMVEPPLLHGKPVLIATTALLPSAGIEIGQAIGRNGKFDWADMVAYTIGFGISAAAYHISRPIAAKIAQRPGKNKVPIQALSAKPS